MKFLNDEDRDLFAIGIGRLDLIGTKFDVSQEMEELYIKNRRSLIPKLKDFRRSQSSKESWRKNRVGYMKGIKRFHKSTEGKKLHRSMGRFLSNRNLSDGRYKRESLDSITDVVEVLKAISSIRTHLYIDHEYFMSIDEEVDLLILTEDALPILNRLEFSLINGTEIDKDDLSFLVMLTEPKALALELAEHYNKQYDAILVQIEKNELNCLDTLNEVKKCLAE